MLYLFEDTETGELVELDFPMGDAPGVLEQIEHEGKTLERLPGRVGTSVQRDLTNETGGKMVSRSLPINWPYAKQHDERGRPVFTSHRECQEAVRKAQDGGELVHAYDSSWGKN